MKKYELTKNFRMCLGHRLFQIRALVTINGVVEAFKERVLNTRSGKVREEYLKFVELIYIYFGL